MSASGRLFVEQSPDAVPPLRTQSGNSSSYPCLVGDRDTALGQQVLGITEAETEAVIEPDGVTDDFWRESVSMVAGCVAGQKRNRRPPETLAPPNLTSVVTPVCSSTVAKKPSSGNVIVAEAWLYRPTHPTPT